MLHDTSQAKGAKRQERTYRTQVLQSLTIDSVFFECDLATIDDLVHDVIVDLALCNNLSQRSGSWCGGKGAFTHQDLVRHLAEPALSLRL